MPLCNENLRFKAGQTAPRIETLFLSIFELNIVPKKQSSGGVFTRSFAVHIEYNYNYISILQIRAVDAPKELGIIHFASLYDYSSQVVIISMQKRTVADA